MKTCSRCGGNKPATSKYYNKDARVKCGFKGCCKDCEKRYYKKKREEILLNKKDYYYENKERENKRSREYRKNNRDELLKKDRERYYENKEEILEGNKRRYEENKEIILARNKDYYERNKKEILEQKKEYERQNREQINKVNREYYHRNKSTVRMRINKYERERIKTDVEFKLLKNCRRRLLLALKNNWKSGSTIELIGCEISELKRHLEEQFEDGMSWKNHGEWHIDHIRPCASFDFTQPEQQRECFNYMNLQPLWAEENIRKSDKVADHY